MFANAKGIAAAAAKERISSSGHKIHMGYVGYFFFRVLLSYICYFTFYACLLDKREFDGLKACAMAAAALAAAGEGEVGGGREGSANCIRPGSPTNGSTEYAAMLGVRPCGDRRDGSRSLPVAAGRLPVTAATGAGAWRCRRCE